MNVRWLRLLRCAYVTFTYCYALSAYFCLTGSSLRGFCSTASIFRFSFMSCLPIALEASSAWMSSFHHWYSGFSLLPRVDASVCGGCGCPSSPVLLLAYHWDSRFSFICGRFTLMKTPANHAAMQPLVDRTKRQVTPILPAYSSHRFCEIARARQRYWVSLWKRLMSISRENHWPQRPVLMTIRE